MDHSLTELVGNVTHVLSILNDDWGGLHPVLVHFPIVLLLTAPIFIVLGIVFRTTARPFFIAALILMLMGTAGTYLAVSTGNAAAEILEADPAYVSTLGEHVELAEATQFYFSVLAAVFLVAVLLPSNVVDRLPPKLQMIALGLFLIVYSFSLLVLLNAAHYGGKLVHHHGVRSTLYSHPQ